VKRRLNLALVFVYILCCSAFLLIDECVPFVVLGLELFFIPEEEIGLGNCLRNYLFSVEWDVKPQLSQSLQGREWRNGGREV